MFKESVTGIDLPLVAQTLDYTCGAACFESMFRYLRNESTGEMKFAADLGSLEFKYTPIENIVKLARDLGFNTELTEQASLNRLREIFAQGPVVFVTWWDEDAGHYSLVTSIDHDSITLMDPWLAREGRYNRMRITDFNNHWNARGAKIITVQNQSQNQSQN